MKRTRRNIVELLENRKYFASIAFANHVDFAAGTSPDAIVAADFNGDGKLDIAVADHASKDVDVFYGLGNGAFSAGPVLALTGSPLSLVTGDFNGDGEPDIAAGASPGNGSGATVTVFLNAGPTTSGNLFGLGQTTTFETGDNTDDPVSLAAGNFDNDGKSDIAATDYSNGTVVVLLSTGAGAFATPVTYAVGTNPTAITSLDFDNDGNTDLAVTSLGTDANSGDVVSQVTLLKGTSTGVFTDGGGLQLGTATATTLAAANIAGSTHPDLIVGNSASGASILTNSGTDFSLGNTLALPSGATALGAADFDLDGHPDLVAAIGAVGGTSGFNDVAVAPGLSTAAFGTPVMFATGTNPQGLVVGDFNGDGKPDIATVNATAASVSILLNTSVIALKTTKTTVVADNNPAVFGDNVTFTATVTVPAGAVLPTGNVKFMDGSTLIGTSAVAAGTNTATLVLNNLGVGNHTIRAVYQGDLNFATSSSASFPQTITPTAADGPELSGTLVSTTLPTPFVPGEKATIKIRVANTGNFAAKGVLYNALYLSLDGVVDSSDIPLTITGSLSKASVNLKAVTGAMVLSGSFTIPADVPLGDYVLLTALNSKGTILESNYDNDTVASPATYSAVNQFGTVGGRKNVVLTLPDGDGTAVTYKMTGAGNATVNVGDSGIDVALTGTTAASAVTITGKGGDGFVELHGLSADSAVGTIKAPTVNLAGDITLPGSVNTLTLNNLGPGGALTLGSGAASTLAFNTVSGVGITAASGIKSLKVTSAATATVLAEPPLSLAQTVPTQITTPWIGTLSSKTNFDARLSLSGVGSPGGISIRSATIGGAVGVQPWVVTGDIAKLSVASTIAPVNGAGWIASVSGALRSFSDNGDFNADVSAGSFGSLLIKGNLSGDILAGANLALNTFAVGSITSLRVMGSAISAIVAAGLDPVSSDDLLNPAGTLLAGGTIKSLAIGGAADDASKFLASTLPAKVKIGSATISPAADPRFHL